MTAPTPIDGAMMTDKIQYFLEAWAMNGVGETIAKIQDSPGTVVAITVDDLRALLSASKPAATPSKEIVARLFIKHGGPVPDEGWCINESGLNDFLAELYAAPPAAPAQSCAHRIVDARNKFVQSGYLCIDCGAVFAAVHTSAASAQSGEPVAEIVASHFVQGGIAVKLLDQTLPVGAQLYAAPQSSQPVEAGGPFKLTDSEQYIGQMAGISTAALGYWKEGDSIHPSLDTVALRDVAKLYAKYAELYKQAQPSAVVLDEQTNALEACRAIVKWCDENPPAGEALWCVQLARRAIAAQPAPAAKAGEPTYASSQATNCAKCGEHKHTPLRIDWMGGYICLTCIDKELEALDPVRVLDDERAALLSAERAMRDAFYQQLGEIWETALDAKRHIWSLAWGAARAASPQATATRTHTTQPGESVMGIALRQCGNEAEWRHILACNPKFADMLPHEYFPVGTVLTLPPLATATQPAQTRALTADTVRRTFALAGANRWRVADPILAREVVRAALLTAAQPASGGDV